MAGRILIEGLLVVVLFGATLCLGVSLGRDYERVNAVTAEPGPAIVKVGRQAAAARVDPICRTVHGRQRAVVRSQGSLVRSDHRPLTTDARP
jgi:hypothetical protein